MRKFRRELAARFFLLQSRFIKDVKGVAALEFAIIAPVLILMFLGTYEISTAVSVNRKLARVSSTISDLITQSASLTGSDLDDIVKASGVIMRPYDTNLKIQINFMEVIDGVAEIQESCGYNDVKLADDAAYTVPTKIKKEGVFLVSTKVKATHNPVIAFFGYSNGSLTKDTTGIDMEQEIFLRPRIGSSVSITGSTNC